MGMVQELHLERLNLGEDWFMVEMGEVTHPQYSHIIAQLFQMGILSSDERFNAGCLMMCTEECMVGVLLVTRDRIYVASQHHSKLSLNVSERFRGVMTLRGFLDKINSTHQYCLTDDIEVFFRTVSY